MLARMGHGDYIVIADANFPSDSIGNNSQLKILSSVLTRFPFNNRPAMSCTVSSPIRVHGSTSAILEDIIKLVPLDQYVDFPVSVMDRVLADKEKQLTVPAYAEIARVTSRSESGLEFVERFEFYERSKHAFAVVQTDDR